MQNNVFLYIFIAALTSTESLFKLFSNIAKEGEENCQNELGTMYNEIKWYYNEKLLPSDTCILVKGKFSALAEFGHYGTKYFGDSGNPGIQ